MTAGPWRRAETAYFVLYFDDRDREIAESLRLRADETLARVLRDFSLDAPEGKFDFYLCPDVPSFIACAGMPEEAYQRWMVGNADDENRRLCVLSPRVVTDRPPEAMDKVITHEIVHIAMDSLRPGGECPAWLGEGIATLYAGQVAAYSAEHCPLIGDLEADFPGNGGYDYAGAYVWYLLERCGLERFKRIYAGQEPAWAALYPGFERDATAAWQRRERDGFTANPAG